MLFCGMFFKLQLFYNINKHVIHVEFDAEQCCNIATKLIDVIHGVCATEQMLFHAYIHGYLWGTI